MKRSFPTDDVTAKRRHANVAERLVDLPDAFAAFSDPLAAERALQKGLLKNWNATEKYNELGPVIVDHNYLDQIKTKSSDLQKNLWMKRP